MAPVSTMAAPVGWRRLLVPRIRPRRGRPPRGVSSWRHRREPVGQHRLVPAVARLVVPVPGQLVGPVLLVDEGVGSIVGVDVPLAVADGGRTPVVGIAQVAGHVPPGPSRTSRWASPRATVTRFDFGEQARCTTAWARLSWASGSPTNSTARAAASATTRASGSASPMSSLARMTSRRAMKRASSPDSSIRANQYRPASGSEPRTDLMKALTWS